MNIFPNMSLLAEALAQKVAEDIELCLKKRGKAVLSVPGGTTPAPFLHALSEKPLSWDKVFVLLGDERFVPPTSERSNTRLLRENFFINHAQNAQLLPLYQEADRAELAAQALIDEIKPHLPIDVLIVGMGEDMHTASLFPDSPDLPQALRDDAPELVVIHAENAGEPRISLSAKVLRSASKKYVLIQGQNKLRALQSAKIATSELQAPIRIVLEGDNPAQIYYAKEK